MKLSQFFLPTLKEVPSEAQVISHRLMLRAGMIHQTSSGIYAWLPLGFRVLKKIENIITREQDKIGAQKVILPTLQSADLWRKSGRYEGYGKEMLRIKDRHDRDLLYSPTAEEVVTDIFQSHIKSYKQLPQVLYQIHWKFRDEIRPRFGVMRGREFLMKDAYSFDLDFESSKKTYESMYEAYLRTFKAMGLTAIPVKADTGPIGGDLSHEFQVMAPTGESTIYYDAAFETMKDEDRTFANMSKLYSAADEMHNFETCPIQGDQLKSSRGIEIGHIFQFGTKYSEPLGAQVMGPDGKMVMVEMGSYGIGVGRLVAAIIEAHHDDAGIKWPTSVTPFDLGLLNLKQGDAAVDSLAMELYEVFNTMGLDVLYDDRDERAGTKFADMDLIGLPLQVIVGSKAISDGRFEVKNRSTGERFLLSKDELIKFVTDAYNTCC
ncbi:MAG: proline--tRNA ligase [Alphaproteobacteria bacterium]|nr:proline--tRNA ligase [Alphaproteobacteria bacterium]